MIELSLDPGAYVSRAFHGGQASIENDLGYPGGCLNLDLQDVRLRREEDPPPQLLPGPPGGDGLCGPHEHFIRLPPRPPWGNWQAVCGGGCNSCFVVREGAV